MEIKLCIAYIIFRLKDRKYGVNNDASYLSSRYLALSCICARSPKFIWLNVQTDTNYYYSLPFQKKRKKKTSITYSTKHYTRIYIHIFPPASCLPKTTRTPLWKHSIGHDFTETAAYQWWGTSGRKKEKKKKKGTKRAQRTRVDKCLYRGSRPLCPLWFGKRVSPTSSRNCLPWRGVKYLERGEGNNLDRCFGGRRRKRRENSLSLAVVGGKISLDFSRLFPSLLFLGCANNGETDDATQRDETRRDATERAHAWQAQTERERERERTTG